MVMTAAMMYILLFNFNPEPTAMVDVILAILSAVAVGSGLNENPQSE
jgi:hypothetical protein